MSQPTLRQPIPVGKYFLDRGKITPQQLELALKHRAEFGLKLGQSLVELGLVTEGDMVEALRHQARFPCIHLTAGIIDARIAHKLGDTLSRRLRALALNQISGFTTVAMEDPSDSDALEELGHILATRIFPVYAEPTAIKKGLERVFGPEKRTSVAKRAPEATAAASAAPTKESRAQESHATPAEARPGTEEGEPDERAVIERVRSLLQQAFEQGTRAIHLEARPGELVVRLRGEGALRAHSVLPGSWARQVISCLKSLAKLESGETTTPCEGSIPFLFKKQPIEVRVSITPSLHGECATLHVTRGGTVRRELAQLGLDDEQLEALRPLLVNRGGLVLVTGPAGSGRTTTLRALLARFAGSEEKVVALAPHADPELAGVMQVQVDPAHGVGWTAGTQACLRQDPDVLFVHECGERESARALLEASLAGRTVFASLGATSAVDALGRLLALGLEPYLLADALRGVLAQRLVRRLCADCRAPIVPDEVVRARLGLEKDGATYQEGEGCATCQGTGYRGHLALFELLTLTPGLRRALEKGSGHEALTAAARADGMRGLREQGLRQARVGLTTLQEILKATSGT